MSSEAAVLVLEAPDRGLGGSTLSTRPRDGVGRPARPGSVDAAKAGAALGGA